MAARRQLRKTFISLPITLDVIKAKQDLQKVVIIQIRSGFILGDKIKKALMDKLGLPSVGVFLVFRGNTFLLTCNDAKEAKLITNLEELRFITPHGHCSIL